MIKKNRKEKDLKIEANKHSSRKIFIVTKKFRNRQHFSSTIISNASVLESYFFSIDFLKFTYHSHAKFIKEKVTQRKRYKYLSWVYNVSNLMEYS